MNNIEILENYIEEWHETDVVEAIKVLIQEYKELKGHAERYKRIANQRLDDIEEFRKNECNHRCIKNAEFEELKDYVKNNYIPKSKVEEALDKMNERYMTPEAISNSNGATFNYWAGKRDMCIELLEEGE